MKFTPRNLKNTHKGHYVLEHAMLFVVAFISTYALSIFLPMLLGGRRRSESAGELLVFIAEHQMEVLISSLVLAVIINLFIFYRNRSKAQAVTIEFDDKAKMMRLTYKAYYGKQLRSYDIPYDELVFAVNNKKQRFLGYKYTVIEFRHKTVPVCILDTSNTLWDRESRMTWEIIEKLRSI